MATAPQNLPPKLSHAPLELATGYGSLHVIRYEGGLVSIMIDENKGDFQATITLSPEQRATLGDYLLGLVKK